ncbi:MAG: hypothetical protein ABDH61_01115 [Acidilobaceae archaeon]
MPSWESMRVKVSLEEIVDRLKVSGANYVTPRRVSNMLGISTRSAGKILARLEEEGALERYSNRAYRIVYSRGRWYRGLRAEGEGDRGSEEGGYEL